jgi:hypothetical protein
MEGVKKSQYRLHSLPEQLPPRKLFGNRQRAPRCCSSNVPVVPRGNSSESGVGARCFCAGSGVQSLATYSQPHRDRKRHLEFRSTVSVCADASRCGARGRGELRPFLRSPIWRSCFIMWVPDLGLALRVCPGMSPSSGADCSAPGISPCPLRGSRPT